MTQKTDRITAELFNKFMYSTNFLHDIELKEEDRMYKYSFVTRFFLGLIFFAFFLIWFIKSPVTHAYYLAYLGHIDSWIQFFVVLTMALSCVFFSSFGLKDMFFSKNKSQNLAIFWISLLFEIAFFCFIFWVQISGYIKADGQALFSKIGVYLLLIFAIIPHLVWIYRKTNPKDWWMFLKICYQAIPIWFNWNYNSRVFTHNKKYTLLINKTLKDISSNDLDKIKKNLEDRANSDRIIINSGMACVALITIWSLFTWVSIWDMWVYWYKVIILISTYIGLSSSSGILITVIGLIILYILMFLICLLVRKVNITILEQIELFESKQK